MSRMSIVRPVLVLVAVLGVTLAQSAVAEQPTKRPTDEQRGKELYDRHCVACHGAWNKGHGPATQALVRPVPDLVGRVMSSDATIQIVLQGKGAMPGYEQTFDKFDAKRVLDHMAKLVPPDKAAPDASPEATPEAAPEATPEAATEAPSDAAPQAPPAE